MDEAHRTPAVLPAQSAAVDPPAIRRGKWIGVAIGRACVAYALLVVALWIFMLAWGDRWWPATMILFGPRWAALLPMIILLPASLIWRRRWLIGLAMLGLLIAWPIMGLNLNGLGSGRLSLSDTGSSPPPCPPGTLRVLTLNTHFCAMDPLALQRYIDQTDPEIIALQEWYSGNRKILFSDPAWHSLQADEAIIASHHPIRMDGSAIGERDVTAGVSYRYTLYFPDGPIRFFSVHLSSPHTAFRNVLQLSRHGPIRLDLNSAERLREAISLRELANDDTILAGDFNLPADSTIYRSTLAIFHDAFADAGLGFGLTYYSRFTAVRIDHVLFGRHWRCVNCWTGPDVGSPHRPVVADLVRERG
jgi:endonuclease/exonuclease/phosphatase family metal-dependent hydrolase